MITQSINLEKVPCKGRMSGLFGERLERVTTIIENFIGTIRPDTENIIEIIDDECIFNNNNDMRRMYQNQIKKKGYESKINITMRKGRVFLMDMDSFNALSERDA